VVAGGAGFRGRVVAAGDGPVSIGNIANIITVARIAVAPVVLWLILLDGGDWGIWRLVAAVLFIVAISTDGVDGMLARKRNLITTSGILMDPIADKALTGAAFIGLALVAELPWWIVIVVLGRELLITVFRLVVAKRQVIPASRGGKLKTLSQAIALGFCLTPAWVVIGEWIFVVNWILMGAVVVLTVATGIDYLVRAFLASRKRDAEGR
jgi:CDP-diacylglycerol---glycerol-3-phosphate 3-phosphatidyltransferase